MERRRKLKELMGIFKDKVSLIKAHISTRNTASLIQLAVIRATTHKFDAAPPEHRLSAILSLGDHSYLIQSVCIDAIMDRLHKTRSPYVALKCLLIIHNIILNGFSVFQHQLGLHHSSNAHNSLKLSTFRNDESSETIELSAWVRWYASVIECNLITSRVLGMSISSSRRIYTFESSGDIDSGVSFISSDSMLVREINSLVCMVEEICKAPETLHCQKNDVVHDVMMLVGKDYRSTQHQILRRLSELSGRVGKFSPSDSSELLIRLKTLESCRPRLTEIFVNRMRNEEFWELIKQTKMELNERGQRLLGWK